MKTFQFNDFCGPVSKSSFGGSLIQITSLTRMLPVPLLIPKKTKTKAKTKKNKKKTKQDLYWYEHLK